MKYYHLTYAEMPWDNYGELLLTGLTNRFPREDGQLQYERTGPYQPDLIISDYQHLLITNTIKVLMEHSGLKGIQFQKVKKHHIAKLHWEDWNMSAEFPEIMHSAQNTQHYFLTLPHQPEIASQMEETWEVVVKESGIFIDSYTYQPGEEGYDIMRAGSSDWFIVTEKAKEWIAQNCYKWVVFEEIDTKVPYLQM